MCHNYIAFVNVLQRNLKKPIYDITIEREKKRERATEIFVVNNNLRFKI